MQRFCNFATRTISHKDPSIYYTYFKTSSGDLHIVEEIDIRVGAAD